MAGLLGDLVPQIGLCIGHDMILQAECKAKVTTLPVAVEVALDDTPRPRCPPSNVRADFPHTACG